MRNLVSLLSVILLFIGCAWGSLLENELTGSDSVLSESLGTSGVLPPSGLKFVSIAENASRQILVTWNSVANAKEYEVTVKGDHNETVKVATAQYRFPITMDENGFSAEVTLKTININNVVSASSAPLSVFIGTDAVYNEECHNFYASRGTETSIKLTYSPAKDADRYMLERRRSRAPEEEPWDIINPGIVNANFDDPEYYYFDQTAKEGYRYDYRITPIDVAGIAGIPRVAKEGFSLPLARSLKAGQGGEGVYDGNKGIFAVEWIVQTKLLDFDDQPVEDEVLNELLADLAFEIRTANSATGLDGEGANFSADWSIHNLPMFSNYNGSNFNGFTVDSDFTDSGLTIAGAKIYQKSFENSSVYRLYIIVDGSGHNAETNPIWETYAYFQVRSKYGNKYTDLPWSNKAYGYAVRQSAANLCLDLTVTAAESGAGEVSVSWTGGTASNWAVFMKKEDEAGYTVIEGAESVSGTEYSVGGLEEGSYSFGVAAVSGDTVGIIFESDEVNVSSASTGAES